MQATGGEPAGCGSQPAETVAAADPARAVLGEVAFAGDVAETRRRIDAHRRAHGDHEVGAHQADVGELVVRQIAKAVYFASIDERAQECAETVGHARHGGNRAPFGSDCMRVVVKGGHLISPSKIDAAHHESTASA